MLWALLFAGSDFYSLKHTEDQEVSYLTCGSSQGKSRVQDPREFSTLCMMCMRLELSRKHDFILFLQEVIQIEAQVAQFITGLQH